MISELHIENIAVIERADIAFGAGFNVLTGETGAGKSIVIDSIDAVLGGRVSRELVRAGAEKALVNAVFTDVDVSDWLAENDLDAEEELILQRRISADGKSACRVNGAAVTVQQLRALGALLLDIHGQNDGRQLLDEARHLDYLDRFAGETAALDAYRAAYETYRGVKREMDRLRMDELEKERLTDRLSAEIEELEKAKLAPGEEAELESRQGLMKNAVRLTEALEGAYGALYEADESALGLVADAERFTAAAAAMAPELEEAAKSISEARFLLTDAAERIGDLRDGLNFSEEEFDRVETRLALLRRLERKYNTNEAGLAERLDADRARLSEIESADDLLVQLERDLARARSAVLAAGKTLTERRRAAGDALAKRIEAELRYLSMPSARFCVEIAPSESADGFDATGCDRVRFLMSANAGEAPGRIARIASGGELSRIMLAMKCVFAEHDRVQSMVFDEIDTGVSGVAAQRVAEKMGELSRSRQVLCITHLPQIAAMADTHFSISKAEKAGRTYTTVTPLDREGRLRELARLYGGDKVTETTLRAAAEQLAAAEDFKKSGK